MWFFGGCEYCTTKMLLCGLSGVLFSLILTWLLSTGKVGSKNKRMIVWQIISIYLEQRYSDIRVQAFGRNIFI